MTATPPNGTEPADAPGRRRIRGRRGMDMPVDVDPDLDLDTNMVVRAGAGSGKTTALVERMIALVRSGIAPEKIVAITFTRRAAGELQERFITGLADAGVRLRRHAAQSEYRASLLKEADRVDAARRADEKPFIGTIHSFCSRILRARAFEAGLPPDFEQIDDAEEERMRRAWWRRFVSEAGERGNDDLLVLREAELSDRDLFDFFGELVDHPDAVVEHLDPATGPDLTDIAHQAFKFVEQLCDAIPWEGEQDAFIAAMEQIRRGLEIRGLDSVRDRAAFLQRLTDLPRKNDGFRITLKHWSADSKSELRSLARNLRDGCDELGPKPFARFVDEDVEQALRRRRVWLHGSAYRFASKAVAGYRDHRITAGRLTWDDLLREAARLMERQRDARTWAQNVWPKVLVDEFQDTDPVQARLLFEMLSTGDCGDSWQNRRLIPGSLFIVGDDKQSIYRFRRADFQVFRTCERAIAQQGGALVTLTANFRSDPNLCDWINRAMQPAFAQDGQHVQAEYQNLEPFFGSFNDGPVVTPVYLEPDGRSTVPVIRAEARWIASEIDRLTGTKVTTADGREKTTGYGDFMILVRRGAYIPLYVSMLAERGIPVGIGGGDAENAADTLALVDNLLRCVLNPADGVALVSTLAGPVFGVSDQELLEYRAEGGTFDSMLADVEHMGDGSSSHGALRRARHILVDIRDAFETMAPYAALVHTVTRHGLLASLAARVEGDLTAGILVRLMTDFRSWEAKGWNWAECVHEVSRYRTGDLDLDIHSLSTPRSDRARVMTIHQAKGLEAEVVFLADPKGPTPRDPVSHVYLADDGYHLALPVSRKERYRTRVLLEPPQWDRYQAEERLFDAAESRRLLYVACTRARRKLFVSMMHDAATPPYSDLAEPLTTCKHSVGPLPPDRDEYLGDEINRDALRERVERVKTDYAAVRARIATLRTPSWRFVRPSDLERNLPDEARDGYGPDYGIAVHHLLESLVALRKSGVTDELVERDARSVLEAESVGPPSPERINAAADAGRGFVASELWPRITRSDRVLTEVPFTVSFDRNGVDEVLSGVVDLAFHSDDCWMLVDYKTDRLDPERLAERYGGQVSAYAEAWQAIFPGDRVKTAIWSTEHDRLVPVDGNQPRD